MASSTIKLSDEKAPTVGTAALSNARTVLLDLSVLGWAGRPSAPQAREVSALTVRLDDLIKQS